jgi:hypothetical protein
VRQFDRLGNTPNPLLPQARWPMVARDVAAVLHG